jgi:hypothetical protein
LDLYEVLGQRFKRVDSKQPKPAKQDVNAPKPICGPDVFKEVRDACSKTRSTFSKRANLDKMASCFELTSYIAGWDAWDINELHNHDEWLSDYFDYGCAGMYGSPCHRTVSLDNKCYYPGSINYVIYGVMFKLCNSFFLSLNSEFSAYASDYTAGEMLEWIDLYKGKGITGFATPSGNYGPSLSWAYAGYNGWPSAGSPAADRPKCSPTCPQPYSGGAMTVHWGPLDDF